MIEYKNIGKTYNDNWVVRDFNLSIHEGDFVCIVGTSGSGKTTLLKMINGLIKPDEGEIWISGHNIVEEDIMALRRKIGYAIQGNGLFPHLTVAENIGYVPRLEKRNEKEIDEIVDNMLKLVGLPLNTKEKYPNELFGGQQQRVGIARAYANKPLILLMDEPFGAVDSITRYQLQTDLKAIHEQTNCTIIFITHDIQEAFKLGSHILVMDNGMVQQFGTTEEVWHQPSNSFVKRLIDMTR
ncbi:ABC transporter ATP-binding protein [Aerococcaceae bacterium zg-ZUI334]|uniref:ATP-binding cassette domain-containing protein n=1 Tax=Aerococcaceae bacterium zg-252 TaxID=2796928 RepID=UPI001B935DBF|nr:ABC transporter ATP-binding protein [Aerococcaceae bacterium zg-ZUI334]